jgi:inorganic pyrophosphatase
LFYPVIYGPDPGTIAADSEPTDVYVLGVFEPLEEFAARCGADTSHVTHRDRNRRAQRLVVGRLLAT